MKQIVFSNDPKMPEAPGAGVFEWRIGQDLELLRGANGAIIHCDPALTFKACAKLMGSNLPTRTKLVAADLILRDASRFGDGARIWLKSRLLKRVDLFLNYFGDPSGYARVYGVDPSRCERVDFKANLADHATPMGEPGAPGDGYVICPGRSLRDFDTFFAAAEGESWIAAVPRPNGKALKEHGSKWERSLRKLPRNVRFLDDDGSSQAWLKNLTGASLVALPLLKRSLCASGVSTALDSMWLGKPVLMSTGIGAFDTFGGYARYFEAENPLALRQAIRDALANHPARVALATKAQAYALRCGDELALRARFIKRLAQEFNSN